MTYLLTLSIFASKSWKYNRNLKMVIANLFALHAWLIADAVKVPCIFIHPHVPTFRCPPNVDAAIKRMSPTLYQIIFANQDSSFGKDFTEFLWPLLSSHYDHLRTALTVPSPLSINFVPWTDVSISICASPRLLCRSLNWSGNVNICGRIEDSSLTRDQGKCCDF